MFKETQRMIDMRAKTFCHANIAFHRWVKLAEETGIPELKSMARRIRDKLDGIITYGTFDRMSKASTEGFNNKIWWLIRQAYGFRDITYLKLKIFQLSSIQPQKQL